MTATNAPVAPEVRLFLARVRAELADLDPDELAEITDGLEADLGELVAERGPSSLGDPVEYAGELRVAAGIPDRRVVGATRRGVGEWITVGLDGAHRGADRLLDRLPGDPRPALTWLRPLWWLLRGASFGGVWAVLVGHWDFVSILIAALGAVISVQVGRGKLWPGIRRSVLPRTVLLVVNVVATWASVVAISGAQMALDLRYDRGFEAGFDYAETQGMPNSAGVPFGEQAGIYSDGRWVSQIFPYDAAGNPLMGVQLFDQVGKPIRVVTQPECETEPGAMAPALVDQAKETDFSCWTYDADGMGDISLQARIYYPWANGAAQLYNVFPLLSRFQDSAALSPNAFVEEVKPEVARWPFASVPPVSLPGVATSEQKVAEATSR